jgi:hypothetical protein
MPTISVFFGIFIRMYFNDHAPPHFHAIYGEHEVVIVIENLEIMEGSLPRRALGLVREWAGLHRDELRTDWELCRARQTPLQIDPLE